MLEKVERITTDIVVADRLKQWIISNNLQAGDRLPTEKVLSEELGVARHTLREGVKRLAQLGIVGSRVGSGLYINEINFDNVAEYMLFLKQRDLISLSDMYTVRAALEGCSAREASRIIGDEHLEKLRTLVSCMKDNYSDNDFNEYVALDIEFHMTIADATRNILLKGMINAIRSVILSHMSSLDTATVAQSVKQHKELLAALEAHDCIKSEKLMKEHVSDSRNVYF